MTSTLITSSRLDDTPVTLGRLFTQARTHKDWLDRPVADSTLHALYELLRWGPTSVNCSPARLVFVRTPEAKARLLPCLSPGNVEKTRLAPVTAIVGMDLGFPDLLPRLFPHADARSGFIDRPAYIQETAFRNSSLQGAYLILAARALGLDAGPMSGFDRNQVDAAFFADTAVQTNFLCNLGYGDANRLMPRLPRLAFEDACQLL